MLQHWKAIFEKYDLDGDGKISLQELKAMIRGPEFQNDIPANVIRTIMHKADLDESGYLEYPEFIAMVSRRVSSVFKNSIILYLLKDKLNNLCLVSRINCNKFYYI